MYFNNRLSRPWTSGDVFHLHIDCERRTLRACHSPSGQSHTIQDVTGAQRLFIAVSKLETAISIQYD